MSELQSVLKRMDEAERRLNRASRHIFGLAKEKAKAEMDYKVALRQEILKLRDSNHPATLINDLAKGKEEIAQLRFERDIAREMFKAGLESMNNTRTQASLLQTISRWQSETGG